MNRAINSADVLRGFLQSHDPLLRLMRVRASHTHCCGSASPSLINLRYFSGVFFDLLLHMKSALMIY